MAFHLTNSQPEPASGAGGAPPLRLPTHRLGVLPCSSTPGAPGNHCSRLSSQHVQEQRNPSRHPAMTSRCCLLKTTIVPHLHLAAGQLKGPSGPAQPWLRTSRSRREQSKCQSHSPRMTQPVGETELWLKALRVLIPAPPPRCCENKVRPPPRSPLVAEWGGNTAVLPFSLVPAQLRRLVNPGGNESARVSS